MKLRIVPGWKEKTFRIQYKMFGIWWADAYPEFNVQFFYDSIEEADKDVQRLYRNRLWQKAVPPVYYDNLGDRK